MTGEVADLAAGFLDQKDARGGVPFFQTEFPEAIEAARGYAGKIKRRGTVAADAVGTHGEIAIVMQVATALAVLYRKACAQEADGESGIVGNADFLAVERGAFTTCGGEKFVGDGIVNDANEERVALREADRDAKTRIAMSEIGGAVERIDVPAEVGGGFVAGAFFGGNGMVRKIFGEARNDGFFGALVGLRHEIHVAFVGDLRGAGKFFAEDFARFLRREKVKTRTLGGPNPKDAAPG